MAIRWIQWTKSNKSRFALVVLVSVQLSNVCAQSNPAAVSAETYAHAESLVRNHQWDAGIALLLRLLADDPHNLKALNLAGIAYAARGDVPTANQYFEKSLAMDAHFLPPLKNLSINEFNAHQYVSAEKHLLELQRQLPDDPTTYLYLGQIAYRQQNFKLAAERFDHVQGAVLHNPNLAACFAVSLLRSGQKQQAAKTLERIAPSQPSQIDASLQLALGVALAEAGMYLQALPYLQAAFHHDPDSYGTGFDLALAGVEAKDYPTAIATAKDLIGRGHDTSELENLLAEALGATGETQGAIDTYRKAIALNPQDENNYLDFTALCIDHRAFDDGLKVIALGLTMLPNSERLTFMRGIVHAAQDNFELAEKDFQQAAELAPQHDLGAVGLGSVYLERGHSDEAIKVIRDRLRQAPKDASLLYLLGEALIRSGAAQGQPAYVEAQRALEQSVKLNPELCLPHISLGSIYLDQDRFADAVLQFEAARKIDPTENSVYSHLAVAYRHLGQAEKAKEVLTSLKQVLEQERTGKQVKIQSMSEKNAEEGSQGNAP